jgi:hypothetical protein
MAGVCFNGPAPIPVTREQKEQIKRQVIKKASLGGIAALMGTSAAIGTAAGGPVVGGVAAVAVGFFGFLVFLFS